jgi:hypothetical protein
LLGELQRNGSLSPADLLVHGWNGVPSADFAKDRDALLASGAIRITEDAEGGVGLEIPDLAHAQAVADGMAGLRVVSEPELGRRRRSALAECSSRRQRA